MFNSDKDCLKNNFNEKFLNNQTISYLVKIIQDNPDNVVKIFISLKINKATSVFKFLDFPIKKKIIEGISSFKIMELMNQLSVDDRVSFLENIPKNSLKDLIKYLKPEEKRRTLVALGYPENSVGRLMIPYYLAVRDTWSVQEVLDYIRKEGKNSDAIEIIYIVNQKGKLVDDIKIREFLLVDTDTKVAELMDGQYTAALSVTDTEEEANKIFSSMNNRVSLPVIDDQKILLGIVTIDDILWVLNENYRTNIQKLGGMEALNQSYLNVPLFKLIKKRAGWLILLFIGEMFTTTVMQYFSSVIEKAVVLALFIPLVVSSGGNSGSQAASLIIQAMALGEVKMKDWWMVMRREIICGGLLGSILGLTGFIRIFTWHKINFFNYGPHFLLVGLTVFFSLIGVVLWGTFSGSMLPFLIKKFKGDPAASSAPFVATLVDVIGLIIYFSMSCILLRGTLI
ncbi:putative Mg2+ transporter [Blattabacterium sp. (Mastotermes darwiniensis) str. MADAR]|uniref:magnesium transporter n=1 Tax=Blattabacterium sp. (Mastotermes darwiniensis) TaxID=39768 RepID=UPI000231DED6|nr:magnesium transporter [Blattabacterium sp. (Mastotermes darwiniensis)]AER40778.1 putative Mg2+ transporter [Blattabacterium sp. (Mastotermes darwiniensis) str. MADAR]